MNGPEPDRFMVGAQYIHRYITPSSHTSDIHCADSSSKCHMGDSEVGVTANCIVCGKAIILCWVHEYGWRFMVVPLIQEWP